jgi:hypothetical protein
MIWLKISGIFNLIQLVVIGVLILVIFILSKRLGKKKNYVIKKQRQAELDKARFDNILLKEKNINEKDINNCDSINDCLDVLDNIVSNQRNKRNNIGRLPKD